MALPPCRQLKLSSDPQFVDKLRDVVGFYVDPPAHAIVLSVDEKIQIQALNPTQPSLPMKTGRLGTMTHDYKRNGTTALFAALDVLDGTVIGRNMQRTAIRSSFAFSIPSMPRYLPARPSTSQEVQFSVRGSGDSTLIRSSSCIDAQNPHELSPRDNADSVE